MNLVGIIPARYASKRLPGKPLLDLEGKSMIERVYLQARKAIENVYVATDDERIANAVVKFGGNVVMTSINHQSGTDRTSEAIKKIAAENKKFEVVINIQGDEPFIKPEQLRLLASCFEDKTVQIATLAKQITDKQELFNPNSVKVIRNMDQYAIYFSRWPIPYQRDVEQDQWVNHYPYLKHLGIYAYKTAILHEITNLKSTSLEISESLEQNRWIENGYKVYVQKTDFESISIDTPEDLEKIKGINWD